MPNYYDRYSYERQHVWKYQVELMYIPDLSPVRHLESDASQEETERYYSSGHVIIYIDDRNGDLIRASYSTSAFNASSASRFDSALLELNKDNWMEWMLTHLEQYRSK